MYIYVYVFVYNLYSQEAGQILLMDETTTTTQLSSQESFEHLPSYGREMEVQVSEQRKKTNTQCTVHFTCMSGSTYTCVQGCGKYFGACA